MFLFFYIDTETFYFVEKIFLSSKLPCYIHQKSTAHKCVGLFLDSVPLTYMSTLMSVSLLWF